MKYFFYWNLLHSIIATPLIHLYNTDRISKRGQDHSFQHNCLRLAAAIEQSTVNRQIIWYCLSDFPLTVQINDDFPTFTFAELSKANITSEQLYLWSTPIDLIEDYQFYLIFNDSSLAREVFHKCTMPIFGPKCQYQLYYHDPSHSSLYGIIVDFYRKHPYEPTTLTCYRHLRCHRGPLAMCLDWSEIFDGRIDCLDGGFDEEHCWEIDLQQCQDDQYQCHNGQCIPQSFYYDDYHVPDCLDGSDEPVGYIFQADWCVTDEPTFGCQDRTCDYTFLTSSCQVHREYLLLNGMFSVQDESIPDECWFAF